MWGKGRSDRDRAEEQQSHIDLETDQLIAEGVASEKARAMARARFGHNAHLERPTSWPRPSWLAIIARDTRYASRQLAHAPVATATILLSLVIGIGVNSAIFSLADQVLVRALPVEAPHEIVQLDWQGEFMGGGRGFGSLIPHPLYVDVRAHHDSLGSPLFRHIAARSPGRVTVSLQEGTERAQVELVTGDYFALFGIRPELGRVFTADDDQVLDGHAVVILSHTYWRTRLGADPDIVGTELRINARPFTIVGVAPPGFHGTDWSVSTELWMPMMMNAFVHDWGELDEHRVRFQHVYARLMDGVDAGRAQATLQPWFERRLVTDMEQEEWPADVEAAKLDQYLASTLAINAGGQGQAGRAEELRSPIVILSAATALVLLLACLNVANLSLAQTVSRSRETGVRAALGASRRRLMAERLAEAGLLAGIGTGAGVLLAPFFGRWILSFLQVGDVAALALRPELDLRALFTAGMIAVVATLLSGVGPAWFAGATEPIGALKAAGRSMTGGMGLRRALVVGQVGLALVFLVGATLFGLTLRSLKLDGPGFATDGLMTFTVNPLNDGYELPESKLAIEQILRGLQKLPEVDEASVSSFALLTGGGWGNTMLVESDRQFMTEEAMPMNAVSPESFDTLGVRVVRGRNFDDTDRYDEEGWLLRSAIVSEEFVRRYLPDHEPLGVRIDFGFGGFREPRVEIVGVVQDYREQDLRDREPKVYFSVWERTVNRGVFYIRAQQSSEALGGRLLEVVKGVDPMITVSDLRTFDGQIDRLLVFERMLATLGSAFAGFALLLAMIGIYGVLSFAAQSRSKEIGIRVALGARPGSAAGLILSDAAKLALIGVTVALPVAYALGRLVETQLYGVGTLDPMVLAGCVSLLLAVCLAASAAPALRAARVDPQEAFRAE
ncbi:MAG: FtsX-like permease family protein [Acidobacteria bacterium]|nr:FtsX-like permease family protein [Acidobacteriota bacterium]